MSTTFSHPSRGYIELGYILLAFLIYLLSLGIYRLFISPIAHFPGSNTRPYVALSLCRTRTS